MPFYFSATRLGEGVHIVIDAPFDVSGQRVAMKYLAKRVGGKRELLQGVQSSDCATKRGHCE
jgi:hypothetical protein